MQYIPSYAARKNGREAVTYIDKRLEPITGDSPDLHLPGAVHADREAARGLRARGGGDAPARDRQEDPRADGVAQAAVPRRLRRQRRHPAVADQLWKDMESAGLPSTRRTRRATRSSPTARRGSRRTTLRVHGAPHLERHEHEGPRPLLRQRVRRDGHRGAAARRQLVGRRLRGRRGEDPLRAERGEERGGDGRRRIVAARIEGGPFASIWDFTERVDPQVVNKRSLESLVKCGALDSTGASRMGNARRARAGARARPEARAGPADGPVVAVRRRFDAPESAVVSHHPPVPTAEFEKQELLAREGDARALRLRAPALRGPRPAPAEGRRDARGARAAAATARSSRSAGSSPTSSS